MNKNNVCDEMLSISDLESICYDNFDVAEGEEDDDECSNQAILRPINRG